MNFLVDFAGFVDKEDVVTVNVMLADEVEAAERGDEGTGDAEHHGHAEKQHHSCVLLTKAEFKSNCPLNGGTICWGS